MRLINGRGQLGEALSKYIDDSDWFVYHTWDIVNLENVELQQKEFDKFKEFIDKNKDEKICFISSSYVKDTPYMYNKIKAESYIINNVKDWKIIRPPHYIGKGIFQAFKNGEMAWDNSLVDVMSMDDVCKEIIKCLHDDSKFTYIVGEMVSKTMLCSLIQYGAKND